MKYTQTFEFFASEKEAIDFCETYKKRQTRYMAKHHPPFYTPWSDRKGFDGFVVWYYI